MDHLESRDIPSEEYKGFVWQLATYSARPTLLGEMIPETQDRLLSGVWNGWADEVEKIFFDMKKALAQSRPQAKETWTDCDGDSLDMVMSRLRLGSPAPPPIHWITIMRAMLRGPTAYQYTPDMHYDELGRRHGDYETLRTVLSGSAVLIPLLSESRSRLHWA